MHPLVMNRPPKRRLIRSTLAASALSLAMLSPSMSAAQYPVIDIGRVGALIVNLQQIHNIWVQLTEVADRLEQAGSMLADGRLADSTRLAAQQLHGDLQSMGYSMQTITSQFNAAFPDEQSLRSTPPQETASLALGWEQQLHDSSLAAARSHATMQRLEDNTRTTLQILDASGRNSSEGQGSALAQTQALVRMIAVINSDLQHLSTTLAATERVNTTIAAADASGSQLAQQRAERAMRNYRKPYRGRGLDRRFLNHPSASSLAAGSLATGSLAAGAVGR